MYRREELENRVLRAIRTNPVTAICGPRQCGKTTLVRQIADLTKAHYFDLEDPVSLARLGEPMTALRQLRGMVVIDEVQRKPELFPLLRVLADRHPLPARFLVLGSASPELLRQGSESLAGRIAFVEMGGFEIEEVGAGSTRRLWWRGGFPRSFLARNDTDSRLWIDNFIRTFLERDIRDFGVQLPAATLRRLWSMLAHYHGQIWNASEISRSLGESHTTVKRHLDLLTESLMVRQLQPWHENLGKRQVKSPKIYLRDSGVLHALLGTPTMAALEGHPKIGASWEGFVVEEVVRTAGASSTYFWKTQAGAELDLLVFWRGLRVGIEIKYKDAPAMTKSMRVAMEDLSLDRLLIVYPGLERYPIDERAEVLPAPLVGQALKQVAPQGRRKKPSTARR